MILECALRARHTIYLLFAIIPPCHQVIHVSWYCYLTRVTAGARPVLIVCCVLCNVKIFTVRPHCSQCRALY